MDHIYGNGMNTMKDSTYSFTSKDGATINYRVFGQGPGLIILPGSSAASQHYLPLTAHLAGNFTVYIVERRGRNGSDPQGEDYRLRKECEDAIALFGKTQAPFLFGHSYGGFIALNVALQYPLAKIAVYEPPVSINGSVPAAWITEFEQFLEKRDYIGAQICIMKGLQLDGELNSLPDSALHAMLESHFQETELEQIAKLLPTVPKELREVVKFDSKSEQYAQITAETLLLAGNKSPAYFHQAIHTLESVLPHSETRIFPGLDHSSPMQAPEPEIIKIAESLKKFFGKTDASKS